MPLRAVDANTLKTWLDKGEAILVDVREPGEHGAAHIPGAFHLPLGKVTLSALPDASRKKMVVHCKSGRRGGMACEKLLTEDPNLELYNLEGGLDAWTQAGHEINASGKFFLPLDRQVQLTIGLCLVIGSWFGYAQTNPLWFLLTGVFGIGLTIAGTTGFCGLAMLMAKAPWNQKGAAASCCAVK
jgi:rhodanese-related sulfurtransferase